MSLFVGDLLNRISYAERYDAERSTQSLQRKISKNVELKFYYDKIPKFMLDE